MELKVIVDSVQTYMANEFPSYGMKSGEVFNDLEKSNYKNIVKKYLEDRNMYCDDTNYQNIEDLLERIFNENCRFGILTDLIENANGEIEEIDINRWDDVKVRTNKGEYIRVKEKFLSKENAENIVTKMLTANKTAWGNRNPIKVGSLGKGKRITVGGFGIVDEDAGLVLTLRMVNQKKLEKKDIINISLLGQMWDLLSLAIKSRVSIIFCGATNSGKTTLANTLVNDSVPNKKRLFTLEQQIREVDTVKRDAEGNVINNTINLVTRPDKDEDANVDFAKLITFLMTMNPDYIYQLETKGKEARQLVEAANTDHCVITTTHANSSEDAIDRIADLAEMDGNPYYRLKIAKSFPIVCHQRLLDDEETRVVDEIVEMTIELNEKGIQIVVPRPLYHYEVEEYIKNAEGEIIDVKGHFVKDNCISEKLQRRFKLKGCTQKELESLLDDLQ